MAKLQLNRSVLEKARERSMLSEDERKVVDDLLSGNGKNMAADPACLPLPFLKSLLDDARLSPNQRAVLALQVHGMIDHNVQLKEIYDLVVSSPVEFGSSFALAGRKSPNVEMFSNGRWYPVILQVHFQKDDNNISKLVFLQGNLSICEIKYSVGYYVSRDLFLDDEGRPREMSVLSVLQYFGFRALQTSPTDFNLKLLRAERTGREAGKLVRVTGPGMRFAPHFWYSKMESRAFGTAESPRKAIIEPELEVCEDQRGYYSHQARDGESDSRLPFVRVFSLQSKCYLFVDVDDIQPHEYDPTALAKLHLPAPMLQTLTKVFATSTAELFGDLIEGKHGGVVILACGKPGVGKTLTAEVYAEQTERPLYVLELGELGTNVAQVEDQLQRVFSRVARWNAVLQFDECEIFLTERGEDLERSAIVGIFLRLLDYYEGILFLTTNRPEALDHAIRSRVMLRLDYPDLDQAARAVIWKKMFSAAGLTLVGGSYEELAEQEVNGRQIRNLSRLARILHPEGEVSVEQMRNVLKYGSA